MIYELRTYTVKPGTLGDMIKAASTISRDIRKNDYGKLEGYWSTEIGPLNQVLHMWSYDSFDERARLRAELARNPRWWDPENISDPKHVQLDHEVMASWKKGDHARVIDRYPELRAAAYEGLGGHYLQMVGAMGGRQCTARGEQLSAYENAMGTGNVHIWFDTQSKEVTP